MSVAELNTASRASGFVALLRPREWVKNAFVLAPLVFAGAFSDPASIMRAVAAFLLFCIASSSVYVLNDIHDVDEDRMHPVKARKRPLAAGIIGTRDAMWVLVLLYGIILGAYVLMPAFMQVVLCYIGLNIAHTWFLQKQPVVDIFSISIGFVMRVYAGAQAIAVPVSSWMFVTSLCLALYLATTKRRQELNLNEATRRDVLKQYTMPLLDRYAQTAATGALVFYSLFVMSTRPELVFTIPIVLFGLFRYAWLVEVRKVGESPSDALLGDWQLMVTIAVWLATCVWAISVG